MWSVWFLDLIAIIDAHLSMWGEGGGDMWQHLNGHRFVLLNELMVAIDLKSYNSKDLKC